MQLEGVGWIGIIGKVEEEEVRTRAGCQPSPVSTLD